MHDKNINWGILVLVEIISYYKILHSSNCVNLSVLIYSEKETCISRNMNRKAGICILIPRFMFAVRSA